MNPLRRKRESLGLTMYQIADRLNIDIKIISIYELGKRVPKTDRLYTTLKIGYQMEDNEIVEYLRYMENKFKENKR